MLSMIAINEGYYDLPVFIPYFMTIISSHPSSVKWALTLIIYAALRKSAKSNTLTPCKGCLTNNGRIFLTISDNFLTRKITAEPRESIL